MATVKYWYCNGNTLASVDVTMTTTSCAVESDYNDGYNVYISSGLDINFSIPSPISVDLYPRFSYRYQQWVNNELTYDGIQITSGYIPAGSTHRTLHWICKEERWDNNGAQSNPNSGFQQLQQ